MSVVFAIMGIKWWFRRKVKFAQPDDQERAGGSRSGGNSMDNGRITSTDNHAEQLSLTTTGIYRRSSDVDGFAPIDRPKTLPRKCHKYLTTIARYCYLCVIDVRSVIYFLFLLFFSLIYFHHSIDIMH